MLELLGWQVKMTNIGYCGIDFYYNIWLLVQVVLLN